MHKLKADIEIRVSWHDDIIELRKLTGCDADEFECADRQGCILTQFVCDRRNDCSDYSDEVNCSKSTCSLLAW